MDDQVLLGLVEVVQSMEIVRDWSVAAPNAKGASSLAELFRWEKAVPPCLVWGKSVRAI